MRKKIILVTLTISSIFLFSACSPKNTTYTSQSQNQVNETDFIENKQPTTTVPLSDTEAISTTKTDVKVSELPAYNSLLTELSNVLAEIGATDFTVTAAYKTETDNLSITLYTDQATPLHIDCLYIDLTDHWSIVQVYNIYNGHCYYTVSGDRFSDIYDYKTDILLSESQESIEDYDPLEEFNEALESNNDEFNQKMESIADEYGIPYQPVN